MNPYSPPQRPPHAATEEEFDAAQWAFHPWSLHDRPVRALHREPFRLRWVATQLVTFVFVIDHQPIDMASIDEDYASMRQFASQHKKTWLPVGFQCGYALLPIYVGHAFAEPLIHEIQNRFRKRWCVFHVPSLLDADTGEVHTLTQGSYWGTVYRPFIHNTVDQVSRAVQAGRLEE